MKFYLTGLVNIVYILSTFRVFPVTINSTTIFNMGPVVGPLLSLLQQETLPDDGVAECQKVTIGMTMTITQITKWDSELWFTDLAPLLFEFSH